MNEFPKRTPVLQDLPPGYILLYFHRLPKALILTRINVESSFRPVYHSMVGEKFQIYGVQITGTHLRGKKSNLDILTHAPSDKTLLQVLITTPYTEGNYSFTSPGSVFL